MPEPTLPYAPGTPCWADVAAPDQQAALDFYRGVFGWSGQVGPAETGGYAVCELSGKPVAGVMAAVPMDDQPPPPTVWTTYLATDDIEATEAAVGDAGGTVMVPPMDVMSLGRMMIAADPTGAVFGVWQAVDFPGAGVVNEQGAVIWCELNTTDRQAASEFYSRVFGMETTAMEGVDDYYALTAGGRTVGGTQPLPEGLPPETPSHWLTYFATSDTDDTVSRISKAGGTVLQAPFDMIAGRMALVTDPQGAPFAVIAPAPMNPS
ncbi:VOC family protein [Streptomyces sp. NPDC059740]|uniref:VOC family protein n=1 Tax=Streptomyces sp. NPDC059740 TaxID=3346926 RepID=UPI00365B1D4A